MGDTNGNGTGEGWGVRGNGSGVGKFESRSNGNGVGGAGAGMKTDPTYGTWIQYASESVRGVGPLQHGAGLGDWFY